MNSSPEHFDAIVIGGGQGSSLALSLAKSGRKTAIIEKANFGGTCVNVGCTPTKTMVASARVAYLARRAADYGVQISEVAVDLGKVRERKRAIVQDFRQGNEEHLKAENLEIVRGEARFIAPKTLEVLGSGPTRTLNADTIIIAVGTQNKVPPINGLDQIDWLDSTRIMELDCVPEHLLIVGGGIIAVEFAQMFRRFGSQVTIIEKGQYLLGREDEDVSQAVRQILEEDGIKVLCGAQAQGVAKSGDEIVLKVLCDGKQKEIAASHLLVAVGREPATKALNLEATGVQCDAKGFVLVDEALKTNVEGIYALGDVAGSPPFTHMAYDDFRILCANLVDGKNCTTRDRLVPWVVFLDPQLGRVGLSEREAKAEGVAYEVARLEMDQIARPLETDETRGFWKILLDPTTGRILGAACLSIEGGEVMAMLQIAMIGGLTYDKLRDLPIAHPTLAESLNNLFLAYDRGKAKGLVERRSETGH